MTLNSNNQSEALETQIKISEELLLVDEKEFVKIDGILNEVMKMLNKLISGLENNNKQIDVK